MIALDASSQISLSRSPHFRRYHASAFSGQLDFLNIAVCINGKLREYRYASHNIAVFALEGLSRIMARGRFMATPFFARQWSEE